MDGIIEQMRGDAAPDARVHAGPVNGDDHFACLHENAPYIVFDRSKRRFAQSSKKTAPKKTAPKGGVKEFTRRHK
jgi:hypothetical protein